MEYLRVCNLRCLADSTKIELKPINLLVGANSSGKSSFLRVLPLLRQSHEMRTLGGLVLNEGDVDFGFFNEALHKGADPQELKLEFGFKLQHGTYRGSPWNSYLVGSTQITCELTYSQREKDHHYPRLRSVRLEICNGDQIDQISISSEESGAITDFSVNDLKATPEEKRLLRLRIAKGIVPQLLSVFPKQGEIETSFDVTGVAPNGFNRRLLSETEALFHGKTSQDTRLATFDSIRVGSKAHMLEALQGAGASKWQQRVRHWNIEDKTFNTVRNLLLAKRTADIFESANLYVSQLSKSVYYFQPVRARAERDYLSRDVSVTSVNPSGLNVAMVLASLSYSDQRKFREWMKKYFGFEVFPQSVGDGARVALRMREAASGTEFNLADTGFGFSQMLPFLVQVWNLLEGRAAQERARYRPFFPSRLNSAAESFIIAIEQPELHLHPALQAKLADLFVAMATLSKAQDIPMRFFLETHSQTIIERIGQAVEAKLIAPMDVQVILFELDITKANSNTSTVRTTSFDGEGVLQDWPFGFLSPSPAAPAIEPVSDAIPYR